MTTMHEEWTDKLSDYLDGELSPEEHYAVESHLTGCDRCSALLNDLKRVVARAQSLPARPPHGDLWRGISDRIEPQHSASGASFAAKPRRRISFTLPQLAAAAVLLMAVSGGIVWQIVDRARVEREATAERGSAEPQSAAEHPNDAQAAAISFADAQYDAAVADLESAVKKGRGRLDPGTIAIVEHNLEIIDQAIEQARQALAADPANTYLSSHLFEARRRKLDLLRRAAALTNEAD